MRISNKNHNLPFLRNHPFFFPFVVIIFFLLPVTYCENVTSATQTLNRLVEKFPQDYQAVRLVDKLAKDGKLSKGVSAVFAHQVLAVVPKEAVKNYESHYRHLVIVDDKSGLEYPVTYLLHDAPALIRQYFPDEVFAVVYNHDFFSKFYDRYFRVIFRLADVLMKDPDSVLWSAFGQIASMRANGEGNEQILGRLFDKAEEYLEQFVGSSNAKGDQTPTDRKSTNQKPFADNKPIHDDDDEYEDSELFKRLLREERDDLDAHDHQYHEEAVAIPPKILVINSTEELAELMESMKVGDLVQFPNGIPKANSDDAILEDEDEDEEEDDDDDLFQSFAF